MKIFNLPDLGEGLPDAEIHEWHIKEGDIITADEIMVSMETAKAVVDVPAPRSGKVIKLFGAPGDIIYTGEPLIEFEHNDEEAPNTAKSAAVSDDKDQTDTPVVKDPLPADNTKDQNKKVLPAIRMLAKRLKVDLSTVIATGPGGKVTAQDVENAAASTAQPAAETKKSAPQAGEPLRGVRRAMAIAMSQSHQEVVPVTLVDDADIHNWAVDQDITARIIRAVTTASQSSPALNAWYHGKEMRRELKEQVNIGLAMDSEDGLFVPVIKSAQSKTPAELREIINRFKTQVSERSIPQEDLKEATISISNFGVFAGRYANPIVVPPTVAIVGVGRIRQEVVAVDNSSEIHRVIPLSVSIDHRAVTGGEVSRFLAEMIADLVLED